MECLFRGVSVMKVANSLIRQKAAKARRRLWGVSLKDRTAYDPTRALQNLVAGASARWTSIKHTFRRVSQNAFHVPCTSAPSISTASVVCQQLKLTLVAGWAHIQLQSSTFRRVMQNASNAHAWPDIRTSVPSISTASLACQQPKLCAFFLILLLP